MGSNLTSSSCFSLSSGSLGCYKDDLPRMMGARVAYSDTGMTAEVSRSNLWRGMPASGSVQYGNVSVLIEIMIVVQPCVAHLVILFRSEQIFFDPDGQR